MNKAADIDTGEARRKKRKHPDTGVASSPAKTKNPIRRKRSSKEPVRHSTGYTIIGLLVYLVVFFLIGSTIFLAVSR